MACANVLGSLVSQILRPTLPAEASSLVSPWLAQKWPATIAVDGRTGNGRVPGEPKEPGGLGTQLAARERHVRSVKRES